MTKLLRPPRRTSKVAVAVALIGYLVTQSVWCQETNRDKPTYAMKLESAGNAWRAGKVSEAERGAFEAAELAKAEFGVKSKERLAALDLLVGALNRQRKYAQAGPVAMEAYQGNVAVWGAEHDNSLHAAVRLIANRNGQGDPADVEKIGRRTLPLVDKRFPEPTPFSLHFLGTYGVMLLQLKQYQEAEAILHRVVPLQDRFDKHNLEARVYSIERLTDALTKQGRRSEAERYLRLVCTLRRDAYGESPTLQQELKLANSIYRLANNLREQVLLGSDGLDADRMKKLSEMEEMYKRCIDIRIRSGDPDKPGTFHIGHLYLHALQAQGKSEQAKQWLRDRWAERSKYLTAKTPSQLKDLRDYASWMQGRAPQPEFEQLLRDSISRHRDALGDAHPDTIRAETLLANKLDHWSRFVESLEIRHRILNKVRLRYGEDSLNTAIAYNAVGLSLGYQNQNAEAEYFLRRSLEIQRKHGLVGTLNWATSLHNLAGALGDLGRLDEAIEIAREALAIDMRRKAERGSNVSLRRNSLAVLLARKGMNREAAKIYEELIEEWRASNGPWSVAMNNLGASKIAMHDFQGAKEIFAELAELQRNNTGSPSHGAAISQLTRLGMAHHFLGENEQAIAVFREASTHFEEMRRNWALAGLERATTGHANPATFLAVTLANDGQFDEAWKEWESTRARGLLDEFAAREASNLADAERVSRQQLLAEIHEVESALIDETAGSKRHEQLSKEYSALQAKRFAIEKAMLQSINGQAAVSLAKLQASIPANAAIVGWLDPFPTHKKGRSNQHWGIVVRSKGPARWVRLPGSDNGEWTDEDRKLRADVAAALGEAPSAQPPVRLQAALNQLAELRLKPLEPHLGATAELPRVSHLIVIPSKGVAGVPIHVLTQDYSVSYAPSATAYLYLANRRKQRGDTRELKMLAVADPIFSAPTEASHPPAGIVVATSSAKLETEVGIRPGDVLTEVDGREIHSKEDVDSAVAAAAPPIKIAFWRDGKTHRSITRGALTLGYSPLTAAQYRKLENETSATLRAATSTMAMPELPGTRREVAALEREMQKVDGATRLLLREDATDAALRQLNRSDMLAEYQFIHLATHGVVDTNQPQRSALILSTPRQSSEEPADARLTAGEVLTRWRLNADLVTLSACQTALGRYAAGEGHIGFAQSLLIAGADSVLLSLWKVDDAATALLMQRFYQNILGSREAIAKPMPKHEALREAQSWLRQLSREEAQELIKHIPNLQRGQKTRRRKTPALRLPAKQANRPYAAPYYWAAFVLVGNSDSPQP